MKRYNRNAYNDSIIETFVSDERYQVHPDGRVFILFCGVWRQTGKALTDKRGKRYNHLKYRGRMILVHRIVYRKFVGALDASLIVNHKDGDSLNNKPENLELVTQQENAIHAHYA